MLSRIALRIATIEALKGATLVGDEVLDSQMSALDVDADGALATDQEKPFISVYCETSVSDDASWMRSLHHAGSTDLVLEFGVTGAMTDTDQETGESKIIGIGIPATDGAYELFLDVCGRQVVTALSDPGNAWAEVWRGLSSNIVKIERKRAANVSDGTKIAAHQWIVSLDLIPDPVFGEPLEAGGAWKRFFDRMDATQHPYAGKLRDLLGDGVSIGAGGYLRRHFNMSLEEARALALDDGDEAMLEEAVVRGSVVVAAIDVEGAA